MDNYCILKIECRNCEHLFFVKIKEGKEFGEQNYALYHRPPLTCPKCGVQETSDYDHNRRCYFFKNFENLGRVTQEHVDEVAAAFQSGAEDKDAQKEEKK